MALVEPTVDFNYFLNRKYAQLQQQADATTSNAASQAITANANAGASAAAALLDTTRAKVLPAESAATIGLQGAQAGLLRTQAQVLPGTAASENALRGAQAGLFGVQTATGNKLLKTGLFGGTPGFLPTMAGASAGDRVPPITVSGPGDALPIAGSSSSPTAQAPGESYSAWVARLRAAGFRGGS